MNRRVWTRQPQIAVGVDWSNPLSRGLWASIESGQQYDAVRRILLPADTAHSLANPARVVKAGGIGGNTQAYLTMLATQREGPLAQTAPWSMAVTLSSTASVSLGCFFGFGYVVVTTINFSIDNGGARCLIDYGGNYQFYTGAGLWDTGIAVDKDDKVRTLVLTHDGTNVYFYRDGSVVSGTRPSGIDTVAGTTGTDKNFVGIGNNHSSGNTGPAATIYCGRAWNRCLSKSEVSTYVGNPWQLFAPLSRPVFAPTLGAGSGNLYWIIQDAAVPDPSGLQVCTGLDGNGNPAFKTGTEPCPSQGSGTTVVTELSQVLGMTGGAGYELFWAWSDA